MLSFYLVLASTLLLLLLLLLYHCSSSVFFPSVFTMYVPLFLSLSRSDKCAQAPSQFNVLLCGAMSLSVFLWCVYVAYYLAILKCSVFALRACFALHT